MSVFNYNCPWEDQVGLMTDWRQTMVPRSRKYGGTNTVMYCRCNGDAESTEARINNNSSERKASKKQRPRQWSLAKRIHTLTPDWPFVIFPNIHHNHVKMTLPNDKMTKGKTERGATKQRYKISDNHEVLYGSAAAATVNFKENYRFGEKKGKNRCHLPNFSNNHLASRLFHWTNDNTSLKTPQLHEKIWC